MSKIFILCLILLAFIEMSSAASDYEISIFAKGVIASDSTIDGTVVTIENDSLIANYFLQEYDSKDPDMLTAKAEWVMDAMIRVIQEYPNRFSGVYVGVFDGQKLQAQETLYLKGGYTG